MLHGILNEQERLKLNQRTVEVEQRTGAQIVLAVITRSDIYAELPWKAFALGSSVASLIVSLLSQAPTSWSSGSEILQAVVMVLACGAACALICVYMPGFARLFLSTHRAEVEVHQHAMSLFLAHELFATRQRTGVLLLISLFERRVVVLPDTGIGKRLSQNAMQDIIARMTAALANRQVVRALEEGLSVVEQVLAATASGGAGEHDLSDKIIEEKSS